MDDTSDAKRSRRGRAMKPLPGPSEPKARAAGSAPPPRPSAYLQSRSSCGGDGATSVAMSMAMRRLRDAPGKRRGSTSVLGLFAGANGSAACGGSHAQLSMKAPSGAEFGRPTGARARGGDSAPTNAEDARPRPAGSGGTELERPIMTGRDATAEAATAAGAAAAAAAAAVAVQMDEERTRTTFLALGDAKMGSTIERARPRDERGGTGGTFAAAADAAALAWAWAGKDCAVLVAVGLTGLVSALLELEGDAEGAALEAAEEDADEAAEEAAALTDTVSRTTVGLGARRDAAGAAAETAVCASGTPRTIGRKGAPSTPQPPPLVIVLVLALSLRLLRRDAVTCTMRVWGAASAAVAAAFGVDEEPRRDCFPGSAGVAALATVIGAPTAMGGTDPWGLCLTGPGADAAMAAGSIAGGGHNPRSCCCCCWGCVASIAALCLPLALALARLLAGVYARTLGERLECAALRSLLSSSAAHLSGDV